jgi:translation initiation factor IF-2
MPDDIERPDESVAGDNEDTTAEVEAASSDAAEAPVPEAARASEPADDEALPPTGEVVARAAAGEAPDADQPSEEEDTAEMPAAETPAARAAEAEAAPEPEPTVDPAVADAKRKLRELQAERDRAIGAKDREALRQARRRIHALKRKLRRAKA